MKKEKEIDQDLLARFNAILDEQIKVNEELKKIINVYTQLKDKYKIASEKEKIKIKTKMNEIKIILLSLQSRAIEINKKAKRLSKDYQNK